MASHHDPRQPACEVCWHRGPDVVWLVDVDEDGIDHGGFFCRDTAACDGRLHEQVEAQDPTPREAWDDIPF